MARTDPGYNGFSMDYLVPQTGVRINSSDMLCHPSQRTSNYTNTAYPKLQVQPGGYVAMKYLENGHVTLPWNQLGKPAFAGTVFVYGTTQPSDTEMIADVLAWTTDGKGGNGKGFLMTAQNFDDGRCHQVNCGNISTDRQLLFPVHVAGQPTSSVESWCETDLQIPASQPRGTLTTYWVWQWPTAPNHDCTYPDGKDEYYTTCADFEIISDGSGNGDAKIAAEAAINTLVQENPQTIAVSGFMSRTAYTTSPEVIMMSGTQTVNQKAVATSGFFSACSAGQTAQPTVVVPASCDAISIFTGAAVASASQAVKADATTMNLVMATEAPNSAAVTSAAADSSMAAPSSAAVASSAAASSGQPIMSANASAPIETATYTASSVTTVTVTENSVVTATTYAATDSIPTSAAVSSAAASEPAGSSIAYPMISIGASGPAAQTSAAALTASTPVTAATTLATSVSAASAPTVGSDGMVEDVVLASTNRITSEHQHVARHAGRRHARNFR